MSEEKFFGKNFFYAIGTILIWSTSPAVVKLLLADMPNMQALSVSGFVAFLFLLIINLIRGKLKLLRQYHLKDYLILLGLGFVGLFLYSALYYAGIGILSSQEACILNYLWPIMIVVFSALLLKEKMTVRKIAALLLSLSGVIVIMMDGGNAGGQNQLTGILLCVAAAVCYGLFSVLNKKVNYDQNIAMMFFWLTVGVCSLILGLLTETWVPVTAMGWAGFAWLGAVIDGLAYLLWGIAVNSSSNTAKIANMAYLTPFLSIVVSAVVLKEKITVNALIALCLIIGGILLQSIRFGAGKKNQ